MAEEKHKEEEHEKKEEKKTSIEESKTLPILGSEEKEDKKEDLSKPMERNIVLLFAVFGAVIGYISFLIVSPLIAFAAAIVIFIVAQIVVKAALKLKTGKLISGNALVVYFTIWLVAWTLFYNLQLIASY